MIIFGSSETKTLEPIEVGYPNEIKLGGSWECVENGRGGVERKRKIEER